MTLHSRGESIRFLHEGIPSFSTRRDITLPTFRSRSPCASWAPPLHRGLVRGSFPAPHHHDPNEMLPNFQIWVMVVCLSNGSSRCHRALEASSVPSCFVLFFSSFVSPLQPLGLGLLGRCDPRNFFFFDVTDAAIEFVSGKEGLRPLFSLDVDLLYGTTGIRTLQVRLLALPEDHKRPWPLRGSRGDGNGGRFVRSPCLPSWRGLRLLHAVHQMLSLLVPVQRWSNELPATTVGERRRRRSL